MSSVLSFCDSCLQTSVEWCEDIWFATGLTAATSYEVRVTNHLSQVYSQNVISDSDGNITIDISKFPEQFFNPYGGIYTLEVYNTSGVLQDIINAYEPWPCIAFDVYELNAAN